VSLEHLLLSWYPSQRRLFAYVCDQHAGSAPHPRTSLSRAVTSCGFLPQLQRGLIQFVFEIARVAHARECLAQSLHVPLPRGSEFRVQGSGFRVQGSGSGFRVQGSGFRVQGSGFRFQGAGFRVSTARDVCRASRELSFSRASREVSAAEHSSASPASTSRSLAVTWWGSSQFENNYFKEMCCGSEAGSYVRLIDFVYHSTLGLRVKPRSVEKWGEILTD